ncbi:lipoprotein [Ornithinibacillus scapharcae]|uniref:lipoprotein n=1 Tax=Ornithinibacillus scapharcae TaxID=1147159 RepID=UPI000225B006|nr:lipoprotein [Ornithinibacillus scapharcae]
MKRGNRVKKYMVFFVWLIIILIILAAFEKKYYGKYTELGEHTNSNTTDLLDENEIPYKIENGIIYIPEDAFDDFIFCCS